MPNPFKSNLASISAFQNIGKVFKCHKVENRNKQKMYENKGVLIFQVLCYRIYIQNNFSPITKIWVKNFLLNLGFNFKSVSYEKLPLFLVVFPPPLLHAYYPNSWKTVYFQESVRIRTLPNSLGQTTVTALVYNTPEKLTLIILGQSILEIWGESWECLGS